ncbi:MAG: hypothetical protein NPIRA05_02550 [Nitrospirales bacterium]|nr:MAG: hypothetical protein NPIRA05_02550 [Nitrospirales bacterium]
MASMNVQPSVTSMSSILLVDDDPKLIPAAIDLLGLKGYLFETVKTRQEAMTRVAQKSYGAVLLDLGVEENDEGSLFHSLSSIDPLLPIILLVTENKAEKRNTFVKLGAFDLLRKPFREQELQETLQRVASVQAFRRIAQNTANGLMASAERYQSIVETARDAIILGDLNGNILSWNKAAADMFGYHAKEIVGQPLTRLMPARFREPHTQGLKRIRLTGETRAIGKTLELQGLKKGGEEFPIELSLSRSVKSNEQFYCGIIRDITSRKCAEAELLERNHILELDAEVGRILSRHQTLPLLLQGCTEALVRHLNATFARIWTLNPAEQVLELQASAGLYTRLDGSHARIPVGHLKIGTIAANKKPHLTNAVIGDPSVPEQEWAKREGLVAFAGFPLLRDQEVLGVMAIFSQHPITRFTMNSLEMVADHITTAIEREIANEAHIKSARHREHILASAGEGIYGLDLDCKVTFVNPAGAKTLGYQAEELIGQSVHTSVHHGHANTSDDSTAMCPMCATLKNGVVHHVDQAKLWRKDSSNFPAEYTSTPMWEDGRQTGAVVTFQDISERTRMAEQLLEEAKLAEVTRVLGDIAHDMKNMLMPVLNGATLIEEELQDHFANLSTADGQRIEATKNFTAEALGVIVNNTRRLHTRVREISDTVKGTISPPRFAPCLLSEIVKAVFESLRFYGIEKGVSFDIQGVDALPQIHADENRLFNALYNLVNNAIPETPPGGSITITGQRGVPPSMIVLTVADTGKGMPPEIRDTLFTKNAISHKIGGTGLGTKIVKDAIDDHGGTITVESTQGEGTTFTIQLPVHSSSSNHS